MSSNSIRLDSGVEPVPGYRLVRVLGQGGAGQVWLAEGPGVFRCALKFLPAAEPCADREMRSLELLRNVAHPNLIAILGFWQIPGFLVVGMELAEDGTLWDRFAEAKQSGEMGIPLHELLDSFQQAARALDFLESRSLQHGDIKPQNLLRMGGGVKVSDFGQVRLLEQTISTHTGAGMTFAYSPPEFFNKQTAKQSDQYSLAVTWCHLRGGRLPFTGTPAQVMAGHMQHPPDLTMLPEEERPAVIRALEKNPLERWPSCAAFVEALRQWAGQNTSGERFDTWSLPLDSSSPVPTPVEFPEAPPFPEPLITSVSEQPRAPSAMNWLVGLLAVLLLLGGAGLMVVTTLALSHAETTQTKQEETPSNKEMPVAKGKPPLDRPPPPRSPPDRPPPSGRPDRPPARVKVWEKEIRNSIGMKLVRIPPGTFLMGSPPSEKDREPFDKGAEKQHEVEISKEFWLGIHEITQAQFQKVMGYNPSYFSTDGSGRPGVKYLAEPAGGKARVPEDTSAFPVENVSWQEARDFCDRLSQLDEEQRLGRKYRLPTESEWEYSCRGGAPSYQVFHFGNSLSSRQADFNGTHPYGGAEKGEYLARTCKVGSYKRNGFGLHDMHGNVWEWCQDWYDDRYYAHSPKRDPAGPARGLLRVVRGGTWYFNGQICRSACRFFAAPTSRDFNLGFRVSLVPLASK